VKFKVDQNLPVEVAEVLTHYGHDAATVFDQGMLGAADPDLFKICQREGRAFITFDLDFGDIRAYPPKESAGLIVLRLARQDKPYVLDWVGKMAPLLGVEPVARHLWVIDESGIRIRGREE
jgi:hypothetical protein